MLPDVLLWLFPVVFVLHEAEETAFLPSWLHRRGERLSQRFPHLSSRLLPYIAGVSRRTFACIAAEELFCLWPLPRSGPRPRLFSIRGWRSSSPSACTLSGIFCKS